MNCPRCAAVMNKVHLEAGVEVDVCDAHGVWLDVGELPAILAHAEKKAAAQGPSLKKTVVGSAASGAGFGLGAGLASALVRSIFD